jgi:hypothetical protein
MAVLSAARIERGVLEEYGMKRFRVLFEISPAGRRVMSERNVRNAP